MSELQWTLITGASSGIGAACARALAREGRAVWLAARRTDRLKQLCSEIEKNGGRARWSSLDVADPESVRKFAADNGPELRRIDVLVNNAGLAKGMGPIQEGTLSQWETMIQTNVLGLLRVTRLIVPHMVEKGSGHIVNIGSVAGRWAYTGGNVYSATKSAVAMISESLRIDLLGRGVRVTEIKPGMVETEFALVRLGDAAKARAVYAGMTPLTAEDVAEAVVWSLSRPPHVNIQEIVLNPTDQASPSYISRPNLPR